MHDKKISNPTSNVYVKISLIASNHNKSATSRTRERNHTKKKKNVVRKPWKSKKDSSNFLFCVYKTINILARVRVYIYSIDMLNFNLDFDTKFSNKLFPQEKKKNMILRTGWSHQNIIKNKNKNKGIRS